MDKAMILSESQARQEETVKLRRYLHEHPEVSSEEEKTSAFFKDRARKLGLEIIPVPADDISKGTGFIAVLDSGRQGKTLGIRAELDGLPVQESEEYLKGKKVSCSKIPGRMHGCGHDGHLAMADACMHILSRHKDS